MKEIFNILIGFLIWLFLIPLLIIPISFLILWKCLSLFVALTIHKNCSPAEMSILDTSFTNPAGNQFIGLVIKLNGKVSLEEFKSHFRNTFLTNDKFRIWFNKPAIIFGFTYMTKLPPSSLIIDNHIYEKILTFQNEDTEAHQILQDNSRISDENSKWEIVLLQLPQKTTVVLKIDHVLGDAVSMRYVIDALFENVGEKYREPPPPSFMENFYTFLRIPATFFATAKLMKSNGEAIKNPPFQSKFLEPNQDVSYATGTLDFNRVKKIAKKANARILSVQIALQLSALNRLFQEQERIGKEDETLILENQKTLIIFPLSAPNHPAIREGKCCNHSAPSFCISPLPGIGNTSWDRREHLSKVNSAVEEGNSLRFKETMALLYSILSPIFPTCLTIKTARPPDLKFLISLNPFVLSEKKECSLLGKRVEGIFFVSHFYGEMFKNTGFSLITPITVGGRMDIAVHCRGEIFGEGKAERFMEIMKEEADLLAEISW